MYIIHFEDNAFLNMMMHSVETFLFPMRNAMRGKKARKNDYGHEIFGHLFGSLRHSAKNVMYNIQSCNIALTAKTTNISTYVPIEIFNIKNNLREILHNHIKYIGTFHTHPYRAQDIEHRPPRSFLIEACNPTSEDEESDPLEIPYMLDTILLLSNKEKAENIKTKYVSGRAWNMVEFCIGKLYFIISVNVRNKNNSFIQESDVKIEIPKLLEKKLEIQKGSLIEEMLDSLL